MATLDTHHVHLDITRIFKFLRECGQLRLDATLNVFVSASVRPSWEELAVEPIHETGAGETGTGIGSPLGFPPQQPDKGQVQKQLFF